MEKEIRLPSPNQKGIVSIEETLNRRTSVRNYRSVPLKLEEVSQLLWAASGKNLYRRTAPSAGATYPLEYYLVAGEVEGIERGLFHYAASTHGLEKLNDADLRIQLAGAALGQRMIERAPVTIVVAAECSRTTGRYGERGIRYVYMEAGHAGQNLSLQAIALNLGTVMIGAFDDHRMKQILGIREEPLYLIPVGRV